MKNRNHSGFTLVELLVIVALIILLLGLTMPTLGSIRASAWLGEASEAVGRQFQTARQQAISKGVIAEVRLMEKDGAWLGMQTVLLRQDGVEEPVTGITKFPESVGIEPSKDLSPLLEFLGTGNSAVSQYGNVNWRSIRFLPSGEVAGDPATAAINPNEAFLTFALTRDINTASPPGSLPPDNFATIQVTPATGRITIYRP